MWQDDVSSGAIIHAKRFISPYAHHVVCPAVLKYDNLRAAPFKTIRTQWRDSRLFMGKLTITAGALGSSADDEAAPGIHPLALRLRGASANKQ